VSVSDLVCMGDQLIRIPREAFEDRTHPYATLVGLRALVGRHPNLQGVMRAREALDLMRVGSDSAPETLLRLAMADAGLPEPDLQLAVRPGDPVSPTSGTAIGASPSSTTASITFLTPGSSATGGGTRRSSRLAGRS
jgi:hypothetical protein